MKVSVYHVPPLIGGGEVIVLRLWNQHLNPVMRTVKNALPKWLYAGYEIDTCIGAWMV